MTLLGSTRTGLSRLRSSMAAERRVVVEYKAYQAGKVDRTYMDFSPVMVGPKSPRASATLANAKPPGGSRAVRG